MKEYVLSEVKKGKYTFRCPDLQCNRIWDFFLVRHVIGPNDEAISKIEPKVSENYISRGRGYQQCPGCYTWCTPINTGDIRLRCPPCSHALDKPYDFCWACQREWIGEDIRWCGNNGCDGKDPRLRILAAAERKLIDNIPGCPTIRACPKCGMLINHVDLCRSIICSNCNAKFCFICLCRWENNEHLQSTCCVAPVQEMLSDPRWEDRNKLIGNYTHLQPRPRPVPLLQQATANDDDRCVIL